ncbi:MAG: hypothetical protein FGM24_11565 [Candidatus Kapabacteria bacterium]|nr:hypothetical protein [Candidatus Kapabacteria bacterium]
MDFVSPAHAIPAVLILAALPTIRMSVSWPVLLDMPSWAVIAATVAVAQTNVLWAICVASVGIFVSERTTPLAVLCALPWMTTETVVFAAIVWAVGVAMVLITSEPAAPDRPWLANPLRAALEWHKRSNALNWLLPWGGLTLAFPHLSLCGWAAVGVAYGQSLIAQDRARLYTSALVPMLIAMTHYDAAVLWIAAVITYFIPSTEV